MVKHRMVCRTLLALLLAAGACAAQAQTDIAVKIRVASTLARFVEYADSRERGGVLRFCVLTERPLPQSTIDLVQKGGGLTVVETRSEGALQACDVLYVDAAFPRWKSALAQERTMLLTVGDASGFLGAGGAVELILVDDVVRFDVNLSELKRQKIRISAQALKLARKVRE